MSDNLWYPVAEDAELRACGACGARVAVADLELHNSAHARLYAVENAVQALLAAVAALTEDGA